MPSPPPRRLPGNDHAKPNKHVPSAKYLNIPWPRQKAIIAGKHANASNPRSQVIPQIALIIATPKPPHLAASFFLFRTRDVRYWHLTDIRGTATICPLLDQSGHSWTPAVGLGAGL